jgi:hypothetical protein
MAVKSFEKIPNILKKFTAGMAQKRNRLEKNPQNIGDK